MALRRKSCLDNGQMRFHQSQLIKSSGHLSDFKLSCRTVTKREILMQFGHNNKKCCCSKSTYYITSCFQDRLETSSADPSSAAKHFVLLIYPHKTGPTITSHIQITTVCLVLLDYRFCNTVVHIIENRTAVVEQSGCFLCSFL